MDNVLTVDSLGKNYGDFKALSNCSMTIPRGSIYGFIGKNGAGKTTMIRIICGLQQKTKGNFTLFDRKDTDENFNVSRRRMGAVVEKPSIYQEMTAIENLKQQFYIQGLTSFEEIDKLLDLVGLQDTGNRKVKDFSLGMRQRLGIAISLVGNSDFLILDEPTNGLDPQGIIEMRKLILKLNHDYHITFLISSHYLDELSKIATHYGFINQGEIIKEISAKDLEVHCGKYIQIEVNNSKALMCTLDDMHVEYKLLSSTKAKIFSTVNITQLVLALDRANCEVISLFEKEESLESYFINLVGGEKDV